MLYVLFQLFLSREHQVKSTLRHLLFIRRERFRHNRSEEGRLRLLQQRVPVFRLIGALSLLEYFRVLCHELMIVSERRSALGYERLWLLGGRAVSRKAWEGN